MPLTEKGEEIEKNMEKEYGEKKGEEVFYASENKGTISGVCDDDTESITLGGGQVGGLVGVPFEERPIVNVEEGVTVTGTTDAANGVEEVMKDMKRRGWVK